MNKPAPVPANRYQGLDALRGFAVLWMTAFHFCFDLNYFGYLKQNFYQDPFWTWQRSAIVSLFLFCVGLSQAVALAQAHGQQRFWRRWAQVLGCALLVSLGSYLVFPRSFIYFGVLHAIVVLLLVARLSWRWGAWLWLAGLLAVALKFGAAWAHTQGLLPSVLHHPLLNWLGLIVNKPITEDYVPLIPWLAAMWWGLASGQWLLKRQTTQATNWLSLGQGALSQALAWLGRNSLAWYMLHQPVLFALIAAYQSLS